MAERKTTNKYIIFVASPGDVEEERQAIRDVCIQVNNSFSGLGLEYKLIMSEDTYPRSGDPQELLNPKVLECDVFIGILYCEWGSQTHSGSSSGFAEEYNIAVGRMGERNRPEICLFFKKPPPQIVKDPGSKYRNIKKLRTSLEKTKLHVYKEFVEVNDFKLAVLGKLTDYFAKILEKDESQEKNSSVPIKDESSRSLSHDNHPSSMTANDSLDQLRSAVAKFQVEVESTKTTDVQSNPKCLSAEELIRITLITSCWMSNAHTAELFDNHPANLLFKHKSKIRLGETERWFVFRGMLGSSYVPSWFWWKEENWKSTRDYLFWAALNDSDVSVKSSAWKALTVGRVNIDEAGENGRKLLAELLEGVDSSFGKILVSYITQLDDESLLPILDKLVEDTTITFHEEVLLCWVKLTAKSDANAAIAKLFSMEGNPSRDRIELFRKHIGALDLAMLKKMDMATETSLRLVVMEEQRRRGEFSVDRAYELLNSDGSTDIKSFCVTFLLDKKVRVTPQEFEEWFKRDDLRPFLFLDRPPEELKLRFYQFLGEKWLEENLDWFHVDGELIFQALCFESPENYMSLARSNLESEFTELKDMSRERNVQSIKEKVKKVLDDNLDTYKIASEDRKIIEVQVQSIEDEALKNIDQDFGKVEDYVLEKYTLSCLRAILERGVDSDVEYAKPHLKSSSAELRKVATRIIAKYRHDDSVDELFDQLDYANSEKNIELQKICVTGIFKGTDGNSSKLERIIVLNHFNSLLLAFRHLTISVTAEVNVMVEKLLLSNDREIAILALAFIVSSSTEGDIKSLLEKYLSHGGYYYDVVCWLDKILYSPLELREGFRNALTSQLSSEPKGRDWFDYPTFKLPKF